MIIPVDILEWFCSWAETFYGIEIKRKYLDEDRPDKEEYVRFMLGSNLVLVRAPGNHLEAKTVEVWCSDREKLESIEAEFLSALQTLEKIKDEEPSN